MSSVTTTLETGASAVLNPADGLAGGGEISNDTDGDLLEALAASGDSNFSDGEITIAAESSYNGAQRSLLDLSGRVNTAPDLFTSFLIEAPDLYQLAVLHSDKLPMLLPVSTGMMAVAASVSSRSSVLEFFRGLWPFGRETNEAPPNKKDRPFKGATLGFTSDGASMVVPAGKRVIFNIGRSENGDQVEGDFIRLSGSHISRLHAYVVVDTRDGDLKVNVTDASTNGTTFGGVRVHNDTREVIDDEKVVLAIGPTRFEIKLLNKNRMLGQLLDGSDSTVRLLPELPSVGVRRPLIPVGVQESLFPAISKQADARTTREIDNMLARLFPKGAHIKSGSVRFSAGANDFRLTLPEGVDLEMARSIAEATWRGIKMPTADREGQVHVAVHVDLLSQKDFENRATLYRIPVDSIFGIRERGIAIFENRTGGTTAFDLNVDQNGIVGLDNKMFLASRVKGLKVHIMVTIDISGRPSIQVTRVNKAIDRVRRSILEYNNAGAAIEEVVNQIAEIF